MARPLIVLAAALAWWPGLAAALARPPDTRPVVAVMELTAASVEPALAAAASGALATELDRLGALKVLTADGIRSLLTLDHQQQMLGCRGNACMTEIAGAAGADYMVTGQVTRIGDGVARSFALDVGLYNVKNGAREGSANEVARTEGDLVKIMPRAVARLTAKLLATRSGRLSVVASEAGAVVRVDDQVRGSTPLPGPLDLPSGPRALSVEKDGFIAWQTELVIQPGRTAVERVTLVPSPDFIRAYEARAVPMRRGAWIATGVAALGAGAALAFQYRASTLYGDAATPGTFLHAKAKAEAGVPAPAGTDWNAEAHRYRSQIQTSATLSYVSGGVAAVSGGLALWLWLAGDEPGRYAAFRSPALAVDVRPGGAVVLLAGGL